MQMDDTGNLHAIDTYIRVLSHHLQCWSQSPKKMHLIQILEEENVRKNAFDLCTSHHLRVGSIRHLHLKTGEYTQQ